MDSVIVAHYRRRDAKGAAEKLKLSQATISRRADVLGCIRVVRTERRRWTAKELEIVENNSHEEIAEIKKKLSRAGFKDRNFEGIKKQIAKLGIDQRMAKEDAGIYTIKALSRLMGVSEKTIANHINAGRLKADKREGVTQIEYKILDKNVAEFIREYLPMIDIALCDKYWLVGVLSI